MSSGQWSGLDPTCILKDCGNITRQPHVIVQGSNTTVNATVTYSCKEGYNLQGKAIRTCMSNGQWSGTDPTCTLKDCGNITRQPHVIVQGSNTTVNATVTYSCKEGYNLQGKAIRTCMSNGQWSGTDPTCTLKVVKYNESCDSHGPVEQCNTTKNAICTDGRCQCNTTTSVYINESGECVKRSPPSLSVLVFSTTTISFEIIEGNSRGDNYHVCRVGGNCKDVNKANLIALFKRLTAGTCYNFTVKLKDDLEAKTGSANNICTQPNKPTDLKILTHSTNRIEIGWTYMEEYEYFEAKLIHDSTSKSFQLENNKTDDVEDGFKHIFLHLMSATNYTIKLTVVLHGISSPDSSLTSCTKPEKPSNCSIVNRTDKSVTLRWTKGDSRYDYFIINGTKESYKTEPSDGYFTFTPLSSLNPGTKNMYTIETGINCNNSLSEPCSVCVTTLPSKPDNLQINDMQNTSANATWTQGQGETDSFQPSLYINDVPVNTDKLILSGTSLSIVNLTSATLYRLQIVSVKNGTCQDENQLKSAENVSTLFYTRPNPPAVQINITNITTKGFIVEWSNDSSHCDSYHIVVESKGYKDKTKIQKASSEAYAVPFDTLQPGTLYTIKLYTAINETLLSATPVESTTYTETPGVDPESITVTNTTTKSITIRWNSPSGNASYWYQVNFTCTSPNRNRDTVIYTGHVNGTTSHVSGLDPGSNCSVDIQVHIGDQISHNTRQTLRNFTNEEEPEGVSVLYSSVKNSTSIKITWQRPTVRNGVIRRYDILIQQYKPDACEPGDPEDDLSLCVKRITYHCTDCTPSSKMVVKNVTNLCNDSLTVNFTSNISNFSHRISGLHAYMEYSATIIPYTFTHGHENITSVTTNQNDPTGAPQRVNAISFNETTLLATWDPPACGSRNGELTRYTIQYTFANHTCEYNEINVMRIIVQKNVSANGEQGRMSNTLTGLYPYWDYHIKISAWTMVGEGPSSAPVVRKTATAIPGLVRYVQFDKTMANQLHVSWKPPCHPNGVIIGYTVQLTNTDVDGVTHIANTNETNYTITGLLPYRNYTLVVNAKTQAGNGNLSTGVSTRTAVGDPYPPLDVMADTHNYSSIEVYWTPNNFTGPTSYTAHVSNNPGLNCSVNGFASTSCVIGGLEPYTNYSFIVIAFTSTGNKSSIKSDDKQTNETVPGYVTRLLVSTENNVSKARSISVSWSPPTRGERHGVIIGYEIEAQLTDQTLNIRCPITSSGPGETCTPETVIISCNSRGEFPDNYISCILTNTIRTGNYTVTVTAMTKIGAGSGSVNQTVVHPGAPLIENEENGNLLVQQGGRSVSDPKRQIAVQLPYDLMCDASNGKTVEWGVVVAEESLAGGNRFNGQRRQFNSFRKKYYRTWFQVEDSDKMAPYIATPETWNPCSGISGTRKRRSTPREINFVVGESQDCSGVQSTKRCNGDLVPGKSYRVKIYVCTDGGCTETKYSSPISTEALVNIGLIAGVVCAVLALAVAALIVFILRRRQKLCFAKTVDEEVLSHRSEPPTVAAEMKDITHTASKFRKGPIKLIDFPDHVLKLYKDSKLIFTEAYALLKEECPTHPMTAAESQSSRPKNRYTNILPYDHSRVKLLPLDDDEDSDYINANYIPGYTSKREYIATQGPMIATFNDFWRMVWEQNVDTIVMLTKLVEKGRHKCDRYWPDLNEPVFYGDLVVCVQSESHLSDYTIRVIEVKLKAARRMVRQFCYLKWPDMGCPDQPTQLLDFVKDVKEYTKANSTNKGPMVVHCSAGVGRTGTFIAVDYLLQYIRDHDEMDIYKLILDMRNYRCNMVQTEDQFVYIHDCMKEFITVDDEEEDDEDEEPTYINVNNENVYENTAFNAET